MPIYDEKNNVIPEKEVLCNAIDLISEACAFLFELTSPEGKALAFMTDALLQYSEVIKNGDCPLEAASDFTAYSEKVYQRKQAEKKCSLKQ